MEDVAPVVSQPPHTPLPIVLRDLVAGSWVSQAISVAARLGVADALVDGPRGVEDIAEAVGAHPPTLYRLLRALGDVGVVTELTGPRFTLTQLGELLRSDVPGSLRAWTTMMGMPFVRDAWTDLYQTLLTGESAFGRVHGKAVFDYLAEHPDDAAVYNAGLASFTSVMRAAIPTAYDFGQFDVVVDVGGGNGTLLAAILSTHREVRGVLFDRPNVVVDAGPILDAAGVADRCRVQSGSFFESVPPGADAYLISNVLLDWDDEAVLRILRTCRAAMAEQARLLVIETIIPDGTEPSATKLFDLQMLVMSPGGRQRSGAEYASLFEQANLRLNRVIPSRGPASLVEAVPVSG
ncbi:MAG: methyltransferase [Pseudonocardiaceae bacterium]